jgi:hypothetical protein
MKSSCYKRRRANISRDVVRDEYNKLQEMFQENEEQMLQEMLQGFSNCKLVRRHVLKRICNAVHSKWEYCKEASPDCM